MVSICRRFPLILGKGMGTQHTEVYGIPPKNPNVFFFLYLVVSFHWGASIFSSILEPMKNNERFVASCMARPFFQGSDDGLVKIWGLDSEDWMNAWET